MGGGSFDGDSEELHRLQLTDQLACMLDVLEIIQMKDSNRQIQGTPLGSREFCVGCGLGCVDIISQVFGMDQTLVLRSLGDKHLRGTGSGPLIFLLITCRGFPFTIPM